jgi:beta-lactam-binding protein with PASTA domain
VAAVKASYHYRWLAIFVVAACSNGERTAPLAEPAVVPAVTGTAVADAVRAVQSAGLRAELEASPAAPATTLPAPVPFGTCDTGTVAAQDPVEGTRLVRGSTVVLRVTGCPPP